MKDKRFDKDFTPPPEIYPSLRKPFNLNKFNNFQDTEHYLKLLTDSENKKYYENSYLKESLLTAKMTADLINSRKNNIFKLLFNQDQNHRKMYLRKLVLNNEHCFPNELKQDKLLKKQIKKVKEVSSFFVNLKQNLENSNKRQNKKIEKINKKTKKSTEEDDDYKKLVKPIKEEENEYDAMKRKDSMIYEKYRRDSLDMFEYHKNEILEKKLTIENKIDEESEPEKSEEESFNEYAEDSEKYDDDEFGKDVEYSD